METAQTLKALGFPQPKVEGGQFWYEGTRTIEVIDQGEFLRLKYSWNPQFVRVDKTQKVDSSKWYIAPNEELIKSQIEEKYPVDLLGGKEFFICAVNIDNNPLLFHGENFAEACAQAWISIKEKQGEPKG